MTPDGAINIGIRREGEGMIVVLLGKFAPRAQKKRSQSTSLFFGAQDKTRTCTS